MTEYLRPVARALLSASDKRGLVHFAHALAARGVELVSTGGTAKVLREAGLTVVEAADVTGFPEMMDGRVKTLHPAIHGGILAIRENPAHEAALLANRIAPIDLVAIDLYPFEASLARGAGFHDCVETIDIGGPAMIRSAAKNHGDVTVIVDPDDYASVLHDMTAHDGATSLALRRRLAQKAFARTATYDAAISNWLARETGETHPIYRALGGRLAENLRYGENPHQSAAFYRTPDGRPGVATSRQPQGKQLSYNNIADTDAAYELVAEFDAARTAAVAIVKHANPCGVAEGANLAEAHGKALRCDPVSAFGGIVAVNRRLDAAAARAMVAIFTEVIIAPDADEEAIAVIAGKKSLRLLLAGALPDPRAPGLLLKGVAGGFLAQDRDTGSVDDMTLKVVTRRARRRKRWRTCASRSAWPSTSSRTPLFTRGTAPPSASARGR